MRQLIDVRFNHYQDSLLATQSVGTTIADLSIVGMGAAGGLIGGTVSQTLSAASGAVAGAEGKINNDVLYSKSIEIILQQMKTDRAAQATVIQNRLSTDPANTKPYTNMYDAANDLYVYARAGSWTEAMLSLQAQTGAQAQACKRQQANAETGNANATASQPCLSALAPSVQTNQ